MIHLRTFSGKKILVFGLGGSGLSTAKALQLSGSDVTAFDDNPASCEAARAENVNVHDFRDLQLSSFDALVLAPGVPLTHPEPHWSVKLAQENDIEIIGDVELFCRERRAVAPNSLFIAITGTNGKSTTTALITHILKQAGHDVQMGGNIGRAVLTLDELSDDKTYVVECSSYQIDLSPSLDPTIGVHLNVSADHLDRHGTIENYASIKGRLINGADQGVVGIDDELSRNIADLARLKGVAVTSVSLKRSASYMVSGTEVLCDGVTVSKVEGIPSLRGDHNLQNAAVAHAVCSLSGLRDEQIQAGFNSFPGLPHRMEQVDENNGVFIINDSKATNADAAAKALSSFDNIFWILGGVPKAGGIDSLNRFFPKILHAFLIGEAAEEFAKTLDGKVPFTHSGTLDDATKQALEMAKDFDHRTVEGSVAVLLSPACASFDQFANFEIRGEAFKASVLS